MSVTRKLAKSFRRLPNASEVIDACVSAVSPSWGIKRRELRAMETMLQQQQRRLENHFEGSSKNRLRSDQWMRSNLSPDSALETDLESVREAADELYRTFPYVHGAVEHRVKGVIGRGMRPQSQVRALPGVTTEAQALEWKDAAEDLFNRWAKTAGPGLRKTFWKQQAEFTRTKFRLGEGIWVLSDVSRPDKPVPLQVTAIAPERLETPPSMAGDSEVRLGIRKRNGVPITYYIRRSHPNDTVDTDLQFDAIPAERVIHWYDELYEGQSRGLPWCLSIIHEATDFKDFREATIIAAQVQACNTMIVSTKGGNPASMLANTNEEIPMEPGQILFRNDVTDVHGFNPTQPGTTYGMFSEWSLLGLGAGLNYPHGWLVRDRRRASYSAGRLEEIEGGAVLEVDQEDVRDIALSPIWDAVITRGVLLGKLPIDPTHFADNMDHYLRHKFQPPGRRWIDPPKEVKAAVEAINNNLDSKESIVQRVFGSDFADIANARSREVKLEEELGITPQGGTAPPIEPPQPDDSDDGDDSPDSDESDADGNDSENSEDQD